MWVDALNNNYFINNLYDEVPELNNIRVEEFSFLENGNEIKIIFDMPKFADYPPKKWKGCNTISIELNFWNIMYLEFKDNFIKSPYTCNILIENKNQLKITLFGSINCEFKAEIGTIQEISAYCLSAD